jgi:hypothetical protein
MMGRCNYFIDIFKSVETVAKAVGKGTSPITLPISHDSRATKKLSAQTPIIP